MCCCQPISPGGTGLVLSGILSSSRSSRITCCSMSGLVDVGYTMISLLSKSYDGAKQALLRGCSSSVTSVSIFRHGVPAEKLRPMAFSKISPTVPYSSGLVGPFWCDSTWRQLDLARSSCSSGSERGAVLKVRLRRPSFRGSGALLRLQGYRFLVGVPRLSLPGLPLKSPLTRRRPGRGGRSRALVLGH